MAEEIRLRLQEWGSPAPDGDEEEPEDTLWSYWFDPVGKAHSYLIWCERAIGSHRLMLDQVEWRSQKQKDTAYACPWVVGIEGPISFREPTLDYKWQLRVCDAISRDWAPVVYDASSFQFRTPEELRYLVSPDTSPRSTCMYTVHKVRGTGNTGKARYWLHTHGLERAGIPDLEIFDVAEEYINAACELIEAVADLWIEFGTPDPQIPIAIGTGIEIAWRPWQAVVAEFGSDNVGGWAYRREEHAHAGFRAVLTEAESGDRWNAPINILRNLTNTKTTLYKTVGETRRMAQFAREQWSIFGLLFAGNRHANWRFAVKLNYPINPDTEHSEHLWFEVSNIKPGKIEAKLLSTPVHLADRQAGDVEWHSLDRLSDWRIFTPHGTYDPETAEALLESSQAG